MGNDGSKEQDLRKLREEQARRAQAERQAAVETAAKAKAEAEAARAKAEAQAEAQKRAEAEAAKELAEAEAEAANAEAEEEKAAARKRAEEAKARQEEAEKARAEAEARAKEQAERAAKAEAESARLRAEEKARVAAEKAAQEAREEAMRGTPTVEPKDNFNAEEDADALYKAMKGFGCSKDPVIEIISSRSTKQLKEIESKFKVLHGSDLQERLQSELTGTFETAVIARFSTPTEFEAQSVKNAIVGIGTDEDTLINVVCTKNNEEMAGLKKAYTRMFDRDLEKDIDGERMMRQNFRRILKSCLQGSRSEEPGNPTLAKKEAEVIFNAFQKGGLLSSDAMTTFLFGLNIRSEEHLRLVFQEYFNLAGHDAEKAVSKELSGDTETAFLTVIRKIKDHRAMWAHSIHNGNTQMLIRVLMNRCEHDLQNIKEIYAKNYQVALSETVKEKTSGNLEKFLLAIVGPGH